MGWQAPGVASCPLWPRLPIFTHSSSLIRSLLCLVGLKAGASYILVSMQTHATVIWEDSFNEELSIRLACGHMFEGTVFIID